MQMSLELCFVSWENAVPEFLDYIQQILINDANFIVFFQNTTFFEKKYFTPFSRVYK